MLSLAQEGPERMAVTPRWVCIAAFTSVSFLNRYSGIPMTKKKFAELELSLLHLQQNVEIPETNLIIHPVIQRSVEQVKSSSFDGF
jgi:hypothetical protein